MTKIISKKDAKEYLLFVVVPKQSDDLNGHIIYQLAADLLALHKYDVNFLLYTSKSVHDSIIAELKSIGIVSTFITQRSVLSNKNFFNTVTAIIKLVESKKFKFPKKQIYFPWWEIIQLTDLQNLSQKLFKNRIFWSTATHVSTHLRRNKVSRETQFLNHAVDTGTLNKLLYFDTMERSCFEPRLRPYMTRSLEFHFYSSENPSDRRTNKFHVGFFGTQSAQRGLLSFIWLAMLNPLVKFKAVGRPVKTSILYPRLNMVPLIGSKINIVLKKIVESIIPYVKNFVQVDIYFDNQKSFNEALHEFQAIFVAGHILPYSSGVALQSLACEIPVLWTHGNSAHSDQMKTMFPAGRLRFTDRYFPFFLQYRLNKLNKAPKPKVKLEFEDYAQFIASELTDLN